MASRSTGIGQARRQVALDRDPGFGELQLQVVEHRLQDRIEVLLDQLEGLGAGELEQVGGELLDAVELLDGVLQVRAQLRSLRQLASDVLDGGADAGQGVADLVGDDRRQVADRGEAVDAPLELDFPDRLGDVVEGEERGHRPLGLGRRRASAAPEGTPCSRTPA